MDDDLEEDEGKEPLVLTLDRGCMADVGESTNSSDCGIICEGGRRTGEGTREGWEEWMLRVRRGPRKGLVEGVNSEARPEERMGGEQETRLSGCNACTC